MKNVVLFLVTVLFSSFSFAGVRGYNEGSDLKLFTGVQCSTNMTCAKNQDKMKMTVSGIQTPVAATATTITADQCGSIFYNSGAIAINLPEASAVIGCTLTFVTLNASNFDVNPDDADQILVLTNAAGDSIRNATLGNTVVLRAVSASQWVVVGGTGTYTDIN